ncbi:MAG: putative membrane protein [Bacillariaceae sp.]|jgi:uncharacterized membrane protein
MNIDDDDDTAGKSAGLMIDNTGEEGGGGTVVRVAEDSHIRSLTKGLTWRFVASTTTIIIAWYITGETTLAFQIGFIEFFAKITIYYIHERIWAKIRI